MQPVQLYLWMKKTTRLKTELGKVRYGQLVPKRCFFSLLALSLTLNNSAVEYLISVIII